MRLFLVSRQDTELLYLLAGHCRLQVGDQRLPVTEHRTPAHLGSGHAARDFADKPKRGDVAARQAEGAKLRRFGCDDMANAQKVLQKGRSSCASLC